MSLPVEQTADAGPSTAMNSMPSSPSQGQTLRRPASHGRLNKLMVPSQSRSRSGSIASQASVTVPEDGSSSGRTTPELRRRAGKAAASSLLANDAKYKKFTQLVDRSLQSFESVNEWADFISFLSRLLKTLQSPSPPYGEIPRKLVVAKRLAQCLNPALPSGVHQRALDVYAYIFSIIGVEGLKRDLSIWSSGLFPFFQYAATSVRPLLISIYEKYYLALGEHIRPATKAFILALLPGIEEETGDFFDKILSILDKLSEAVSPPFFLSNLFLVLISTASARLSALNYLSRRVLKPPDNADSGLLIRGLAAVLADENVLVRRNGLDLLLRILPLNGRLFSDADARDKKLLVRATSAVVLQRELSLSRRVYTWFLGPGEQPSDQLVYFKVHGLDLLAVTLQHDMSTSTGDSDNHRPFKVFLSLLDKWEIGSLLAEKLAVSALRTVKTNASSVNGTKDDTLATATAVYEAVEPTVIWKTLHASVLQELRAETSQSIELVRWLLVSIPQHDEEVNSVHMPVLVDAVLGIVSTNTLTAELLLDALGLLNILLPLIPSTTWNKAAIKQSGSDGDPVSTMLYDSSNQIQDIIYSEVLPRIVRLAFLICQSALDNHNREPESLLEAVKVVSFLVDQEVPPLASIDGKLWLASLVQALQNVSSFAVVEALVVAALKASQCPVFKPAVDVTSDSTISAVLDSLFRYLRPDLSPYHARAVELLWDFNRLAEIHTLENVIARRMASVPFDSAAFEAFGIFWRFTDDSMLPGEIFNIPISLVLDALSSNDPDVQRLAETWMRCNHRSYFRVLDPTLSRLLDPSIRYHEGRYANPIDLDLIRHYIQSISTLFRFGAQGLSKSCQVTELRHSLHPTLAERAEKQFPDTTTYLEILVLLLLRFIETESPQLAKKATPLVLRVQASALELLQTIVSRGDASHPQLEIINESLVNKLCAAVKSYRLTLQSKILHLLHSGINASSASASSSKHNRRGPQAIVPVHDFEESLVKTIILGISEPRNLSVLQHWIDFVLVTIPQFQNQPLLLNALCECLSQQARLLILRLGQVRPTMNDEVCNVTDAEVIMILNALERTLLLLSQRNSRGSIEDGRRPPESGIGSGSAFLGLVSNVFTVEAPASEVKTDSPRYMDDAIHALLIIWTITSHYGTLDKTRTNKNNTFEHIQDRNRKLLEKVYKINPSSVIASCIHIWAMESDHVTDSSVFDCVDALTPSAQNAVEIICDSVSGKIAKIPMVEYRSDPAYLTFLEMYIGRLEAPIAVQIWTTLFAFAKDVIAAVGSTSGKMLLLPTLRCLTALASTVLKTSALEDRRLRRDLQDTYAKLVDLVVTNAARIEWPIWERGSNPDPESSTIASSDKIHGYLASAVVPNLRNLLVDADRVNSVCSGIAMTIISPAIKKQNVDASVLWLVLEITKIPSAVKTWRIQIGDIFSDSRFFKIRPEEELELTYWKLLICALMDSDKERFPELLSRITSASSANIFSNKEQEMQIKSLNLRRLSFVLLSAERNQYLTLLPAIQERLVEMLRSNAVSPRVHSEVYLCLRVLLCRISPQHLSNFWPVILAELLRIFEQTMDDPPPDGSEQLQLILAACKFLDLLLVLQSEDFQIHQWMFVTDTTDAGYSPEEEHDPEAIMDRLAEILSQTQFHNHGGTIVHTEKSSIVEIKVEDTDTSAVSLRRPRLDKINHLDSIYQLQEFFARASIDTFEGVYHDSSPDWEFVEKGLLGEIFD